MPEISDLRALLRDRQHKAGALGTAEASVCIDDSLMADLARLKSERATLLASRPKGNGSMVQAPDVDTSGIDELIAAKEDEARAATLTFKFRALSSVGYQAVVNEHPGVDDDDAKRAQFMDQLIEACLTDVLLGDQRQPDYDLDEIRNTLTFGEWEPIRNVVFVLNRRRYDVPFSSKPSAKTR